MKALYPGSFDPPHLGHLDIIRRAARVCDQLVVGVAANPDKKPLLPTQIRAEILTNECIGLKNVSIVTYAGATVTWARQNGITALVRGLRNHADMEAESGMAAIHRGHGFETLFLLCDPALAHVSSRLLRQVMGANLPTDNLIGPRTLDALRRWQP